MPTLDTVRKGLVTPGSIKKGLLGVGGGGGGFVEPNFLWVTDDSVDTLFKRSITDYSAVTSYATPTTAPKGLTFDGEFLWVVSSTNIAKVDPTNGSVVASLPVPSASCEGAAWDGEFLRVSDRGSNKAIHRIDPSDGTVLDSIPTPNPGTETLPWGCTFDGTNIWLAGRATGTIYKLNSLDGTVLDSFASPGADPMGLTWDGTNLHLAIRTGTFYVIDPSNGTVISNSGDTTLWPIDITGTPE